MLNINHLKFGYKPKKTLFENVNLHLSAGHIYGLLGKNGAGKSSLLRMMCGLLFPKEGTIEAMGFMPMQRKPSFLQQVYFVPEEVELPHLQIKQFVKVNGAFYPAFNVEQFTLLLTEFEVNIDSHIKDLSYGQQKKVVIAFAIATNARLLLLDEPTNGLDIPSKAQLRKVLAGHINEDSCIIISTHQIRDLDSLIDSIIILDNGEIILNESTDRITEKLAFKVLNQETAAPILYAEPSLAGQLTVLENVNNEASKLDIELLFNAATVNKPELLRIFNN
ncbi:ABC transporter ATP-binding protein [Solitalea koreensis]|uniref:ABC-2 type transport system ATP-binding protein n=1 Tax=Solitalea koreensis TaxID=543615 RepID=A0A521AFH7_9SPHI|nr:ABC transporter ATP-binding protein [Solitalea koreensis]SMO33518.1 ABC-2 type transport system ATP-binding protein [Solitalea koreensis]